MNVKLIKEGTAAARHARNTGYLRPREKSCPLPDRAQPAVLKAARFFHGNTLLAKVSQHRHSGTSWAQSFYGQRE